MVDGVRMVGGIGWLDSASRNHPPPAPTLTPVARRIRVQTLSPT